MAAATWLSVLMNTLRPDHNSAQRFGAKTMPLSAIAKWSNLGDPWLIISQGSPRVKACGIVESGEKSWKPFLTASKINSCLVPRPHYCGRPMRFRSRVPNEFLAVCCGYFTKMHWLRRPGTGCTGTRPDKFHVQEPGSWLLGCCFNSKKGSQGCH